MWLRRVLPIEGRPVRSYSFISLTSHYLYCNFTKCEEVFRIDCACVVSSSFFTENCHPLRYDACNAKSRQTIEHGFQKCHILPTVIMLSVLGLAPSRRSLSSMVSSETATPRRLFLSSPSFTSSALIVPGSRLEQNVLVNNHFSF